MFRCPMCRAEFSRREDFHAHMRSSEACRRTALGVLELVGIPEDRARADLGLSTEQAEPSGSEAPNEFGDRIGYAEAVQGVALIVGFLFLTALAIVRLTGLA